MCGQCGILATTLVAQEVRTFQLNLRFNIFRGRDSTGVAAITAPTRIATGKGKKDRFRPAKARMWKEARDAWAYMAFDDLDKKGVKKEIFDPAGKRLLMGHCRSATVGSVTSANAHPFHAGKIIGMHNGTIKKAFKGTENFETDSEALFNLIDEVGIKEALQEVEAYSTAYAIQYYDLSTNKFHVVRNSDRPLWFVYTKTRAALLWSSEEDDLRYAAKKTGLELESTSFQPKPYELLTFDLSTPGPQHTIVREDLTPKKAYASALMPSTRYSEIGGYSGPTRSYREYQYNQGRSMRFDTRGNFWEVYHNGSWIPESHFKYLMSREKEKAAPEVDEVPIGKAETEEYAGKIQAVYYGCNGKSYMKKDFEMLLMHGCENCGTQPDIEEKDIEYKLGWHSPTQFFCESCTSNPEVSDFLVRFKLKKAETPEDETPFVESHIDPTEDT